MNMIKFNYVNQSACIYYEGMNSFPYVYSCLFSVSDKTFRIG